MPRITMGLTVDESGTRTLLHPRANCGQRSGVVREGEKENTSGLFGNSAPCVMFNAVWLRHGFGPLFAFRFQT